MNKEINNSPIEELGLEAEIVKQLKNVFIYTVGDLQGKAREALLQIPGFPQNWVIKINNILAGKTGVGLSDSIEEGDRIEELKLSKTVFRSLNRLGIQKISELMKLSELEIRTINGIYNTGRKKIEESLRQHYGENYDSRKKEIMSKSPDAIGLGHLNISNGQFLNFRNGGIYTIGDFQRSTDEELLSIEMIGEGAIENVNKELATWGMKRYKEGDDRIGKLKFPPRIRETCRSAKITTVTKLGDITLEYLNDYPGIDVEVLQIMVGEYLRHEISKNDGLAQNMTELQILEKIKSVMEQIRSDRKMKEKTFRTIYEELVKECGGSELVT